MTTSSKSQQDTPAEGVATTSEQQSDLVVQSAASDSITTAAPEVTPPNGEPPILPAVTPTPTVVPRAPFPPPNDVDYALPPEVKSRLDSWHKLWTESAQLFYLFGALSVTASAVAAATGGVAAQYLSAAAAVLTALIGFVQPERRYFKFVNAWRVLDIAALKYKKGRADIDNLIQAVEHGERIISEYESKEERKIASSEPNP